MQPDTTTALFIRTICTMSVTQRYLSMGPHVTTCYGMFTQVTPAFHPTAEVHAQLGRRQGGGAHHTASD